MSYFDGMTFRVIFVVLATLVLHIVTIADVSSPVATLAISPPVNRQEILNNPTKWDTANGQERAEDIHDGRKIFFNNSAELRQCTDTSLFKKLPNITSVSYSSDGKTLNTTFWLTHRPLVNDYFQNSDRASEIKQVSVHLYVEPSQYNTLNETVVLAEEKFLREQYHDISNTKILNNNSKSRLGNIEADVIEFTGNLNYTTLGHPEVWGKDTFTLMNDTLFRILYLAEPKLYDNQSSKVTDMLESFSIRNSIQGAEEYPQAPFDNNLARGSSGTASSNTTEIFKINSTHVATISYPPDWGVLKGENPDFIFYSPIKGPFLNGIGYIVSLDVPAVYEADTDYVAKVFWSDILYNRTWSRVLEEASLTGTTRTLQERRNFTDAFEEQKYYERPKSLVRIPVDLRMVNFPEQYLMTFITETRIIDDGFLCDLIQKTGQVSAPPPKFIISPSLNSTLIGPRETKTIEVKVRSLSAVPYTIFLKPDLSKYMKATFSPSIINIPPSGWASSQLTLKSNGTTTWNSTITETLRIVAQPELTEMGNRIVFNTNRSVQTSTPPIPDSTSIGLTITVFNSVDNALHTLSVISAPVGVAAALAGLIGGGIGWLLKRTNSQQDNKGSVNLNLSRQKKFREQIRKLGIKFKDE